VSTFVVMIGTLPTGAASTLDAAKANAFEAEKRYIPESAETRWDECRGQWRLMSRPKGRPRFAWTQRWVATVPTVDEG
jgi:hypothetical protein